MGHTRSWENCKRFGWVSISSPLFDLVISLFLPPPQSDASPLQRRRSQPLEMNHAAVAAAVLSFLGMKNNRLLVGVPHFLVVPLPLPLQSCPCHPPTLPPANHSQCPIALFWSRWTSHRPTDDHHSRPRPLKPQGQPAKIPKTPTKRDLQTTIEVDRFEEFLLVFGGRTRSLRSRTWDGLPAADGIAGGGGGGGGRRGLNNRYGRLRAGSGEEGGRGERKTRTELDALPISIWRTNEQMHKSMAKRGRRLQILFQRLCRTRGRSGAG